MVFAGQATTHLWTDTVPLIHQPTFARMLVALLLGICVGAERQWRQRTAGLRTNTLVCLGAAAFVDLGYTVTPPSTQVIAYVISGVGFLGAGAIMKDGASIRGLNTAATLWCSAAVGACAGAGELLDAAFVAALLMIINSALRPLSRFIDRHSLAAIHLHSLYHLQIVCETAAVHAVEDAVTRSIAERGLRLHELQSSSVEDMAESAQIKAVIESKTRGSRQITDLVTHLRTAPGVESIDYARAEGETE